MIPENPNKALTFNPHTIKTIYFAGGCFWGIEAFIERVKGVYETQVGYANGKTQNPTYEAVCKENTGHAETVEVKYDETIISFEALLKIFFEIIDPTSLNQQGGDRGVQYRTGIYYTDRAHELKAKEFINKVQSDYEKPIVTEVLPLAHFYTAEEYHQKYLEKNPTGYCHINLDKLIELNGK